MQALAAACTVRSGKRPLLANVWPPPATGRWSRRCAYGSTRDGDTAQRAVLPTNRGLSWQSLQLDARQSEPAHAPVARAGQRSLSTREDAGSRSRREARYSGCSRAGSLLGKAAHLGLEHQLAVALPGRVVGLLGMVVCCEAPVNEPAARPPALSTAVSELRLSGTRAPGPRAGPRQRRSEAAPGRQRGPAGVRRSVRHVDEGRPDFCHVDAGSSPSARWPRVLRLWIRIAAVSTSLIHALSEWRATSPCRTRAGEGVYACVVNSKIGDRASVFEVNRRFVWRCS